MATVNAPYTYTSSLKQQSIDANQQAQDAKAKAAQQASQASNPTSTTSTTSSQTQSSKEQRAVTVQQSLSQGKTAVEAASKANASIGEQLK